MYRISPPDALARERKSFVLSRNISGIQVICDEMGRRRMGTLVQLPEGAGLQICGEGFDANTVKIVWEGGTYYVFLADLEPAAETLARAAAG
ncbi:MAG: hypothetical protein JO217_13975 [Acidobacteriaceae bacterium]|nr:hypothetical protein [Acidobacteriaceae bacterium]MBV9443785.1 hypothetical protein [Acidobacteriaceae bacterium]